MILVFFTRLDHADGPAGAAELVYRLRGGPVFGALKDMGVAIKLPNAEGAIDVPTRPAPDCVAFADLTLLVDTPYLFTDYIDTHSMKLVLDVHFPFGMEGEIQAVQPGKDAQTRDVSIDQRAAELWTTAERIESARRILAKADVLTVPRADWVGPLRQHVRRSQPIVVLPDVTSPQAGAQFYRLLSGAFSQALKAPKVSWWRRPMALMDEAVISAQVRKTLIASAADWEALKRGEATPTG